MEDASEYDKAIVGYILHGTEKRFPGGLTQPHPTMADDWNETFRLRQTRKKGYKTGL